MQYLWACADSRPQTYSWTIRKNYQRKEVLKLGTINCDKSFLITVQYQKRFLNPVQTRGPEGFNLKDSGLKTWGTVIRQLDKPHREQEAWEQKQLEDERFMAGCNDLNPMYFLSSLPVPEVDPLEDMDKEAFGFLP